MQHELFLCVEGMCRSLQGYQLLPQHSVGTDSLQSLAVGHSFAWQHAAWTVSVCGPCAEAFRATTAASWLVRDIPTSPCVAYSLQPKLPIIQCLVYAYMSKGISECSVLCGFADIEAASIFAIVHQHHLCAPAKPTAATGPEL